MGLQTTETVGVSSYDLGSASERQRKEGVIRDHYRGLGAVAAVFLDKDRTMIDPHNNNQPTVSGLPEIIARAQAQGIIVSIDSDSSRFDLDKAAKQFGTTGLNIHELGGGIGLPNGEELQLVRSGEWFRGLLNRVEQRIYEDPELMERTMTVNGDPWPLIDSDTHFPGPRDSIVLLNRGRTTTASVVFRSLDQTQGGRLVRGTPESIAFYEKMVGLMRAERDAMLLDKPFPDPEGIREEFSDKDELAIITSFAASKIQAMRHIHRILGIPIFHIGDGPRDDTSEVKEITTMAVGNADKDFLASPGVIVSQKPMTEGVIDLFETQILPKFPAKLATSPTS